MHEITDLDSALRVIQIQATESNRLKNDNEILRAQLARMTGERNDPTGPMTALQRAWLWMREIPWMK